LAGFPIGVIPWHWVNVNSEADQSTGAPIFPAAVKRIPFVISRIRKNGRAIRKNVPHGSADRWDANFSVVLVDLGGFALTLFLCFVMFEHHSSPHMLLG
jgi:hypothetical protein